MITTIATALMATITVICKLLPSFFLIGFWVDSVDFVFVTVDDDGGGFVWFGSDGLSLSSVTGTMKTKHNKCQ